MSLNRYGDADYERRRLLQSKDESEPKPGKSRKRDKPFSLEKRVARDYLELQPYLEGCPWEPLEWRSIGKYQQLRDVQMAKEAHEKKSYTDISGKVKKYEYRIVSEAPNG
jgi:hypothetical protein